MTLNAGTRLGPYEILAPLGAGGMGEVYRARDTRLERTVAIKILPEALAGDPQFRERFDREARAISQLDHPHICALYDVGDDPSTGSGQGTAFLVMQYLEGETLADRLSKGALPLDQALRIGIEIAGALAAAHRAGIVHRDLKPGNIMLTKSGAKLLDFGLAKATSPAIAGSMSMLPTTPPNLTQQGTILGTFQYMAPEQLEGQEADARTDIFAFGAVLYEMLTGRRAFEGKSQASLIGAILHAEPAPVASVQPLTPQSIDRIVRKCLAKDPDARWQTARDLHDELQWVAGLSGDEIEHAAAPRTASGVWWRTVPPVAAATFLVTAMAIAVPVLWRADTPVAATPALRLEVVVPEGLRIVPNSVPLLSPDGARLVFLAGEGVPSLWVRALDSFDARMLEGTAGATQPFWSPDGRSLGFFADGKLKRVEVDGGGSARVLCDALDPRGASWSTGGVILFGRLGQPLARVPAIGGVPQPITLDRGGRPEVLPRYPAFLPDGGRYLVMSGGDVLVAQLDSPETTVLATGISQPIPAPGHLVYLRDASLYARPFDIGRLAWTGAESLVATDVVRGTVTNSSGSVSASGTGVLAYQQGQGSGGYARRLAWLSRTGQPRLLPRAADDTTPVGNSVVSPDGRLAAFDTPYGGRFFPWIVDLETGTASRLTLDAQYQSPVWSPDGKEFITRSANRALVRVPLDGGTSVTRLLESEQLLVPTDWSRDGKFIVYVVNDTQTRYNVRRLALAEGAKSEALVETAADEREATLSPDGRWLAYASDQSGRYEIYVQPFAPGGLRTQVSYTGGRFPRWRRDGGELFFIDPAGRMMSATVAATGGMFRFEGLAPLFELPGNLIPAVPGPVIDQVFYDVSSDGSQFLFAVATSEARSNPIRVVVNWPALLTNEGR